MQLRKEVREGNVIARETSPVPKDTPLRNFDTKVRRPGRTRLTSGIETVRIGDRPVMDLIKDAGWVLGPIAFIVLWAVVKKFLIGAGLAKAWLMGGVALAGGPAWGLIFLAAAIFLGLILLIGRVGFHGRDLED